MKRKVIYTDASPEIEAELERSVRINDFLPSPEVLRKSKTIVYTDAPPEIEYELEYAVLVSGEEIGLPSPEYLRSMNKTFVTENGITRVYLTPKNVENAKNDVVKTPKKPSSFFAGKVAVL